MDFPQPDITPLNEPFWKGLASGELRYQACRSCGNHWLPAREACPACLAPSPEWKISEGAGKIVSWVVYHTAYHPAFADKLPYIVACIELAEGPRMLTNLIQGTDASTMEIDKEVRLQIEDQGGTAIARFRCD